MKKLNIKFPIVKNISTRLLSDDIIGFSAEETREHMKNMFDKFKEKTGYDVVISGNTLPTKVLIPDENKKKK